MTKSIQAVVLLASAALFWAAPAIADEEVWVSPLKLNIAGGWTASLGGEANLAVYGAWQSGNVSRGSATGALFFTPRLEKLFANEWRVGFTSYVDAYHDRLSGDNYGNRAFAKAYFYVNTPFGDLEIGQQDGAAYKMAITGPIITGAAAIDDANVTFFRDPVSGENLRDVFDIRSGVFATSNDAKISLYTPRLLGVQLGVSYTPALERGVIPFLNRAPHLANRQNDLIDAALNYTTNFRQFSLGTYIGVSAGHNAQRTAGFDNLLDWGMGGEVDYDFGGSTAAIGAAYRQTNGYRFDPFAALAGGDTHAFHGSASYTSGPWKAGVEYSNGMADAALALPAIDFTGYAVSGAYSFNDNLQLTLGWQHERLSRSTGAFYTGGRLLDLDAVFLYAHVHV